jgi:hypothetical protein
MGFSAGFLMGMVWGALGFATFLVAGGEGLARWRNYRRLVEETKADPSTKKIVDDVKRRTCTKRLDLIQGGARYRGPFARTGDA